MTLADLKSQARKAAFARRALAHQTAHAEIPPDLLRHAEPHGIIAAYMPMRTEFDILPSMQALHEVGKIICVPIIQGQGHPLSFHKWTPTTPMIIGEFGARIPRKCEAIIPTLILAPLVAFDARGTRLGYGGGFYDRTLAKLRDAGPCAYWGVAYSAQESPSPLPFEPTDIPLDGVITEKGMRGF